MGHVLIKNLKKEYVERRSIQRTKNTEEDEFVGKGEKQLVLDDINLEFEDGELVCVLGPSGCGKTTLLRIMAGFETPTSGQVVIDGKEVDGPSSDNIFVFQHSGLLPWMTVWENAMLGLRKMKDKEAMAEKITDLLETVELTGYENLYPHQLSGGMQRRAELLRALAVSPEIMFMDEPFAGLDFFTRLRMREEIINMHQYFAKNTIIFVTHDIEEAAVMSDRIVALTKQPAKVQINEKMNYAHPRDFHKDADLEEMRRRIYSELGVHYAL